MTVLITAEELATRLDEVTVLDVRWNLGAPGRPAPSGRAEYEDGHIPGSRWVDLETELAAPSSGPGGRHPLPEPEVFTAAMQRVGVSPERPVVVLDNGSVMGAARLWWMLSDAGHPSVRVLDGGIAAWRDAGLALDTGPDRPGEPGTFVARPGRLRRVDAEGVQDALRAGRRVVDVRAGERYRGEVEPIDPVGGHIPGAINLPSSDNFTDGRMRSADVLRARFADLGAGDVVYCGSGVTATQTLLALQVAGVEDVGLYAGSWSDWVSDEHRPVATGPQPGSALLR